MKLLLFLESDLEDEIDETTDEEVDETKDEEVDEVVTLDVRQTLYNALNNYKQLSNILMIVEEDGEIKLDNKNFKRSI